MTILANGLNNAGRVEESLVVYEAGLAAAERTRPDVHHFVQKDNLASCYDDLGRHEEALSLHRENYAAETAAVGITEGTLTTASNMSIALINTKKFSEARVFSSKRIGESKRVIGSDHDITLCLRSGYAMAIYKDPDSSLQDLASAVETMEKVARVRERVFGLGNQYTVEARHDLKTARAALRARETPSS